MKTGEFLNGRPRIFVFGLLAFLLLTTFVHPRLVGPAKGVVEADVQVRAVSLNPDDPRQRRIGRLGFVAGWELTSPADRFGGISSMHVENGRVTALSDTGDLLEFPLPTGAAAIRARITPLPQPPWRGLPKLNQDSEALAVAGGQAWISFERVNRISRHRRSDWRSQAWSRPPPMRRWPANSGAEGMVRLADRRFLVFAEGGQGERLSEVLLFLGDPAEPETTIVPMRYRRPQGYRVTDAALLPGGDLLILHRRLSWLGGVTASLGIAKLGEPVPGALIEPREIAAIGDPLTVDNMEALNVATEGGRTIVRIASDDNYTAMQRTLLLEFELMAEQP